MKKGFTRSLVSVFLLVCFAPSLAVCGDVNLAPQLVELVKREVARQDAMLARLPEPDASGSATGGAARSGAVVAVRKPLRARLPLERSRDHGQYVPIVPPASSAEFLTAATDLTKYLADLPIDQVMARDLINKLLGAFLVEFNDEIANLLKAFGIVLPPDWATIPLNYLLDLIKFKSYNQELSNQLLTQWQGGMTPPQEEALKRLWLAQSVVKTGFDSSLSMAEDATEGLYDLIDLIYGACNVLKKIGDKFENIPVVGAVIRKIRLMISQRIIFALNNAVDLLTAKMKEPARSRVRGIFTAVSTTYIKWAGIQVGEGFGGISSELLTKIGAKILGKFLLLLPPKIGYVSLTKAPAQYGAERALSQTFTGEFSQAATQVLDDNNHQSENAVLEGMVKTVLRKQKLSHQERQIANVAGAISQVAQLIHFVDPTSFARIVAIGAGILAGGLQLHSVFNSAITLYRLPGQVDQGVRLAFDPNSAPPTEPPTSVSGQDGESESFQASSEYTEFLANRLKATEARFGEAVDKLEIAIGATALPPIESALGSIEDASRDVRHDVKLLSTFRVPADGGPDQMKSLLGEGLMDHDLKSAGVYADVLRYVFRPSASQRPGLVEKIRTLRKQTLDFLASVQQVAASGQMQKGAYLAAVAPTAVLATGQMEIAVNMLSVGTHPATDVKVQLILPKGYTVAGASSASSASLAPGQEMSLRFMVSRPPGVPFKRTTLVVNAQAANAPEVNQSVLVTE